MRSRDLALGDRVVHARTHRAGVVRYFGPVEEAHGSAGNMVGVEYDEPVVETDSHSDMHDGSYRGVQYFNGKQGYVLFCKKFLIQPLSASTESPRTAARLNEKVRSVAHFHLSERSEGDSIRRLAAHAFRAFDADNSGEIDCDEVGSLRLASDVTSADDEWSWSDVLRAAGADPTTNILTRHGWMDYIHEKYSQCTTELQKRWLRDELMQYVDARADMRGSDEEEDEVKEDGDAATRAIGARGVATTPPPLPRDAGELLALLSPSPTRAQPSRFLGRAGSLTADEVASLSAGEIASWLEEHRLSCLADAFARADIDGRRIVALTAPGELYFMYRYILRESCSQFDSLPLTSLTIPLFRA